jgi:hypothetical protein
LKESATFKDERGSTVEISSKEIFFALVHDEFGAAHHKTVGDY